MSDDDPRPTTLRRYTAWASRMDDDVDGSTQIVCEGEQEFRRRVEYARSLGYSVHTGEQFALYRDASGHVREGEHEPLDLRGPHERKVPPSEGRPIAWAACVDELMHGRHRLTRDAAEKRATELLGAWLGPERAEAMPPVPDPEPVTPTHIEAARRAYLDSTKGSDDEHPRRSTRVPERDDDE